MKYRKRPPLIEATQWFLNGDHPQDESVRIDSPDGPARFTEGKVVRYFKSLNIPGDRICSNCGSAMRQHGELTHTPSGEEIIVCPGDYIITNHRGRYYTMRALEFEVLYEPES